MGSQPTKEASGEEGKATIAEGSDIEDARSQSEEEIDEQENHENDEDQDVGDNNTQIAQRNAGNRYHNIEDDSLSTDNRYMRPIADSLINRFFREQDADRRVVRASAAERNNWESAASVSEDTSQSQDGAKNQEDGEKKEDGANEQEEENLDDREEDGGSNENGGDNQDKEENEGNQDDGEEQGDQGGANQDGGGRRDNGEDRDDAENVEDAEDSTDNNSVNSGASSSSQAPVEDQVLPELEEAISDSDSDSPSISVPENLPPLPTSSPTPESPGSTPHLVAPDQISSSANQVNAQASSTTQMLPNGNDGSLVALANLLGATTYHESLPFPFGPRAAASDSASASSPPPTSNHICVPSFLDNFSGFKLQYEPRTSRGKLEIEGHGENNELEGEQVSEEDQEPDSISAPQFSSDDAPELGSGLSANVPTTPLSSSTAPLPFNPSQSSTPNQIRPSSPLTSIPQTLRNLIVNTEQPISSSPSSIPLPANSPEIPSAATPAPPHATLWHEVQHSNIPTSASVVPSSFSDSWSLMSPSNLRYTSFTSSPLESPWVSLRATDRRQACDKLTDTLASTIQQTNSVDRLPPTLPGETTAPQQEINSGDLSALSTPLSTSNYDPSSPPPVSETASIIFDILPATEPESGWVPNLNHFRVNRRRCPMCVRRARGFEHECHGGHPCDACATLGYSAEQCRTGKVGEGGGGRHERSGRKGAKSGCGGISGNIGEVA